MSNLSLRAAHPTEHKEIASLSGRFLSTVVIAMAGFLSLASIATYLTR
jgi:hypothetical protein